MWILILIKGLVYISSLASDIAVVVLTFERYLAISKPHLHKNLVDQNKTIIRSIVTLVVLVISATR